MKYLETPVNRSRLIQQPNNGMG